MRHIVRLAKQFGLKVGAHPSYPDKKNFGRVSMELSPATLKRTVIGQVDSLGRILHDEGVALNHIKPHGALYNDLALKRGKAVDFLKSIRSYKDRCSVCVPYGSVFANQAERMGYKCIYEAFGDRAYLQGHHLAPRAMAAAVLTEPEIVMKQVLDIVQKGRVRTLDGDYIPMAANTICIHGDTPSALQILVYLADELPKYGIYLKG